MAFSPGETIGAYRIIEQLGQGGMASVFKAYHAALDRYVAIKVLHPAFKQDPTFLARFEREARIVAKLDHPNIIPIYDFAEHEGTPYLVIRYVEGQTLKQLMRSGPLPFDRILSIFNPIAEALAYAHAQGVLHRDIKPSNIIIANDGHIYLADFGLARMIQPEQSTISRDMLIGTPQYISPEQAKGDPVDARSDIYSLAVVLFEMMTGRAPFSADTPYSIIHDHIYTPLPLPTSLNPDISPNVERVLLKALDKDPNARYATATEFMDALATSLSAVSMPSHADRARVTVVKENKPRRAPLVFALTVLDGLLLGLLIFFIFLSNREGFSLSVAIANLAPPTPTWTSEPTSIPSTLPPASQVAAVLPSPPLPSEPTVPPAPTDTPQPSDTPTLASTSTHTPSPTSTATATATGTATATATPTLTRTPTTVPTATNTPTITPTPIPQQAAGMVLIPRGVFWMGKKDTDPNAQPDESPGHYVDLSTYYIDQFEVSNSQYKKCVDAGVCILPTGVYSPELPQFAFGNPAFDNYPVVYVSQGNASRYCAWVGKSLPTEAQWEKAARGPNDQRLYPWGDLWDGYRANVGQSKPGPLPVTSYNPEGCSIYGVCNLVGNVAEWVADFYHNTFYLDSMNSAPLLTVVRDPVDWNSFSQKFVVRGGSFRSNPANSRVTKRNAWGESVALDDLGFRCALNGK